MCTIAYSEKSLGEQRLLRQHNYSTEKCTFVLSLMCLVLSISFPELKWHVKRKKKHGQGYWKDKNNQQKFLDEVATKLNIHFRHFFFTFGYITTPRDWNLVSSSQLHKHGCAWLFNHYGSLKNALRSIYPDQPWKGTSPRSSSVSKNQHLLFQYIQKVSRSEKTLHSYLRIYFRCTQ